MVDIFSKKKRSEIMSKIRSKRTNPELTLKKRLIGFMYQPKGIFGSPDFINFNKRTAIFVDGCFWHQCPIHSKKPEHNKTYWKSKLEKNILRDREVNLAYKNAGWRIIRIWEHDLR